VVAQQDSRKWVEKEENCDRIEGCWGRLPFGRGLEEDDHNPLPSAVQPIPLPKPLPQSRTGRIRVA